MAELKLSRLPDEGSDKYFDTLIDNCIKAYAQVYSDSIALDLNGVSGKFRVEILTDERYKRETKKIKAKKFLADITTVDEINEAINADDDGTEPDVTAGEYDIRDKNNGKETDVKKKRKLFDKDQIALQMKAFQLKNEILSRGAEEEEKEGDSLNLFFIPISREEFERLKNVEVSDSTGEDESAFKEDSDSAVNKALKANVKRGAANIEKELKYHMEGDVMVEDL
jgi:hypothetical protein